MSLNKQTDETAICNMAIGRSGLRKFLTSMRTDQSIEAQVCQLFYDQLRDRLLEETDWPFARNRQFLTPLGGVNWSSATTYQLNNTVNFAGIVWISLINNNINNQPDISSSSWRKISRYGYLSTYQAPADCLKVHALWPAISINMASVPIAASTPLTPWVRVQRADQKIPYRIERDVFYGKIILTDLSSTECHYIAQMLDPTLFSNTFIDCLSWLLVPELTAMVQGKPTLAEQQREKLWGTEREVGWLARTMATEFREDKEDQPPDSEFIAIRRGGTLADSANPTVGAGVFLGPF